MILGLVALSNFSLSLSKDVLAGSGHNLSGFAWNADINGGIGWISFNSKNDSSSTVDYGVNIDLNTGNFSGFAWSDVVGWISFNPADVSGCPSGSCQAKLNFNTGAVTGWAKMLLDYTGNGISTSYANGWNGWIELSGINHPTSDTSGKYGVTYKSSDKSLVGFAWSDDVGWINFNSTLPGTGVYLNSPDLDVSCASNPTSVKTGNSVTWTANPTGGTGSYTYEWSGSVTGTTKSVDKVYTEPGTKYASVKVTSGSESIGPIVCDSLSVLASAEAIDCSVKASAFLGDEIVWSVKITGLVYGSVVWSGDVVGTGTSVSASYNTEGQKTGTATVYDSDGIVLGFCTAETVIKKIPFYEEF
jgi:hypothetical protein